MFGPHRRRDGNAHDRRLGLKAGMVLKQAWSEKTGERPHSLLAPSPWGRRVGDEGVRGRVARSALSWHGGPHRNDDSTAGVADPLFF
jgi:hypothetical protein